ncbi:double zinc ribbon domain-containing protein [Luteimonas sp. R10]|uniref:double zinc ribbon domain-containing protein n=1 Tax=Luteimonas sp. R10 TaxID=3108176 RepID=UPI00308B0775|nr:ComF family protein [Luteimonas sp. R10]
MPRPVNRNPGPEVDGWAARLGQLFCPPRCPVCQERAGERDGLCPACAAALPWNRDACRCCALPLPFAAEPGPATASAGPVCGACLRRPPPLHAVHAAFVYGFPVDRLLPRFKFHHDLAAGRLLARWMVRSLAKAARPEALIALPLHRSRLRARGYDQALELAKPLARTLDLPLLEGRLRRTRATAPQSRLQAQARRRNLRGAFAVADAARLPAHVALVDDVMTTGATLHAAAQALHRAGVRRVDAWVCARVP